MTYICVICNYNTVNLKDMLFHIDRILNYYATACAEIDLITGEVTFEEEV